MSTAPAPAGATSDVILERLLKLHPKSIDLSLGRLHRLLAKLGHPEEHLPPTIHVAGTNGKGSVVAMLRAGLQSRPGTRVHVYTSPHLVRFSERIVVANRRITESRLRHVLAECEAANGNDPITFFEITTAAALLAFARTPADYCLLEVGLGGRLDATNVVREPRLTVITRVGLDHQQYLGDTIPEIAREKAGILKPGVPGIVGAQPKAARVAIARRAAKVGASLLRHGEEWDCRRVGRHLHYESARTKLVLPPPALRGTFQTENCGIAVAALEQLGLISAAPVAVHKARWPARLQRLRSGPVVDALPPGTEVYLDGGHNPDAGQVLAEHMRTLPRRPLYMICGMLKVKDASGFLKPFAELVERAFTVPVQAHDGCDPTTLARIAKRSGVPAEATGSVPVAARSIAQRTTTTAAGAGRTRRRLESEPSTPPRVLICGSLYLAGEVLALS